MTIRGVDFDFSIEDAADFDRMDAAQRRMLAAAQAEQARVEAGGVTMGDVIRGQCRLIADFLDDFLGEGAAEKLHLSKDDFRDCRAVIEEIKADIALQSKRATAASLSLYD